MTKCAICFPLVALLACESKNEREKGNIPERIEPSHLGIEKVDKSNDEGSEDGQIDGLLKAGENLDVEAIRSKLRSLPPGEVESAWDLLIQENLDSNRLQYLLAASISELKHAGKIEFAFDLVNQKFGPGSIRNNLIEHCFRNLDNALNRFPSMYMSLESDVERERALTGLEQAMAYTDNLVSSDFRGVDLPPLEFEEFLQATLSYRLRATSKDRRLGILNDSFNLLEEMKADGTISSTFKNEFLLATAEKMPFEIWKMVSEENFKLEPSEMNKIAIELARANPLKALNALAKTSQNESLSHAFEQWLKMDNQAASKWMEVHRNELSQEKLEMLDASFVRFSLFSKDLSAAKHWYSRIEDTKLRANLDGRIWHAENALVSQAARNSPEKTVLEMANGTSEFEPLYLPTALNAWMKEDGEAAAQWVEREGVNLPPETRQFVAMAYAREAANQGQIDLAEQWAELIVDEERKERVMQHINNKR
ncbi:hypothetical protein [Roseibacillus ishigakijimensis]|uniref:Uncharacterized protein n=1 Tax=Roseibacillus ishigakijimensis TaxID=454146 RepID=A0A934RJ24_9BACT|nr:hypothetical protein [Roseibacillus ishigakijimensis]MBK1832552.1 hypothetical protein [Roseibacillus ishigakijimensis]